MTPLNAITYNCSFFAGPGVPSGINNTGIIVGTTTDNRGFIRDTNGTTTFVEYPGASFTKLLTINNGGIITGQYSTPDSDPGTFTNFKYDLNQGSFAGITFPPPYAQASGLSVYGINDSGAISAIGVLPGQTVSTIFVLNSDGTVREVGPAQQGTLPGSLNNSLQLVESTFTGYRVAVDLVQPNNSVINIVNDFYPGIADRPSLNTAAALGLNNLGTIAGFRGFYSNPLYRISLPAYAFTYDASGTFSEVICPTSVAPYAVNDEGVLVGGDGSGNFVASPLPGLAQFQSSVTQLDFGIATGSVSPRSFTVANPGNARMDIARITIRGVPTYIPKDFTVSGCVSQGSAVFSVNPGESCVVTVTPTPSRTFPTWYSDAVVITDSSPGSPHMIGLTMRTAPSPLPTTPPACDVTRLLAVPPKQIVFSMSDSATGLQSVVTLDSANANFAVPEFAPGYPGITFTVTQVDPGQVTKVDFRATNGAGVSTTCGATIVPTTTQWAGLNVSFLGKPAIVPAGDGLEAFVHASDNTLMRAFGNASGEWSEWQSLGGQITSDPAVIRDYDGNLEVFATGTDSALWTRAEAASGTWSDWKSLEGTIVGNPMVVENSDASLEVFARSPDFALSHNRRNPGSSTWSGWHTLGGYLTSDVGVNMNTDGRLEVFARGGDFALWHTAQLSSASQDWSGWSALGGYILGKPVIAAQSDGRLAAFVKGGDAAVWYKTQQSAGSPDWTAWSSLGGAIAFDLTVGRNADGRFEVFAQGEDGGLWRLAQTAAGGPGDAASWAPLWSTLGGILSDGIAPVLNTDGRLEVFVSGSDNTLWHIAQSAAGVWQ